MAVANAMLAALAGSPRRTATAVMRPALAAWSVASSALPPPAAVQRSLMRTSDRCTKANAV